MKILHTNGSHPDFIGLCRRLDVYLNGACGAQGQRDTYNRLNGLEDIRDAVVLYADDQPVAGGSFKSFDEDSAEIKRVFVREEYRGRGLSRVLMKELEERARSKGYSRLILETGRMLEVSNALYRSIGFRVIENYGPYKGMDQSVCMEKPL